MVWGASIAVYVVAVLQLLVYATLQVPVGVAIDHVGPRRLIVAGALMMAVGQAALALAHSVPLAIAARVLVGAGDAMTFVSVLRLVSVWFPPHRVPPSGAAYTLGSFRVALSMPFVVWLVGVTGFLRARRARRPDQR